MIAALAFLIAAFDGPDAAPALEAVRRCDRPAMQALTKGEPQRRTQFAVSAYAEQQAIARDRAALLASAAPAPAAFAALDARQRQLDDARAVEQAWRALIDELRTDFLANCAQGK